MQDFAIQLSHKPGELSRGADALSREGVNIKSVAAMTIGGQGIVRLIADDVEAARRALRASNIRFEESEVVTILKENRAGELADVTDRLANAGVNPDALYVVGLEDDDLVELAVIGSDSAAPSRRQSRAGS